MNSKNPKIIFFREEIHKLLQEEESVDLKSTESFVFLFWCQVSENFYIIKTYEDEIFSIFYNFT